MYFSRPLTLVTNNLLTRGSPAPLTTPSQTNGPITNNTVKKITMGAGLGSLALGAGCATQPKTEAAQQQLTQISQQIADATQFVDSSALADARLAEVIQTSTVPPNVAIEALTQGINGPATGLRIGGVDEPTFFTTLINMISNTEAQFQKIIEPTYGALTSLITGAQHMISPDVKDYILKTLGATLIIGACCLICSRNNYRKNTLLPGAYTTVKNGAGWMGSWLSVKAFFNAFETSFREMVTQGLTLGAISFNEQYFVARIAVWGFLAKVWGLIAILPFIISRPVFQYFPFLRKQTEYARFILNGGFHDATRDNVQKLSTLKLRKEDQQKGIQEAIVSQMNFNVNAEHLASKDGSFADVPFSIQMLPEYVKAEYSHVFDAKNLSKIIDPLRKIAKENKDLDISITATKTHAIKGEINEGTINEHSLLVKDSLSDEVLEGLRQSGYAFISKEKPELVVVKKEIKVVTGQADPEKGEVPAGIEAKTAFVTITQDVNIEDIKPKDFATGTSFKVTVKGKAKKALSLFSKIVTDRGAKVPLLKSSRTWWRRHLEGTPGNVTLSTEIDEQTPGYDQLKDRVIQANESGQKITLKDALTIIPDPLKSDPVKSQFIYSDILKISAPKRAAVKQAKEVTLGISKAALEFKLKDDPNATVRIRDKRNTEAKDQTVSAAELLQRLERSAHIEGDAFYEAVKNREITMVLPNDRKSIPTSFPLTPIEKIGIQVKNGSLKSLHDVVYTYDDPNRPKGFFDSAYHFVNTLGRSLRQGFVEGQRWRTLGAFVFVGATFLSVPTNIVMNMLYGYTSPEMWIKDATKSYFTRSLNMTFAPSIIARIGLHKYNNFAHYAPGMIFMMFWGSAFSIALDQPDSMKAKNATTSLSGEVRQVERAELMEELAYRASGVDNRKERKKMIERSLAHFIPYVHYNAEDIELIKEMYNDRMDDQEAQARLLAGMMNDPGLRHELKKKENKKRFAFFKQELAKHTFTLYKVFSEAGIQVPRQVRRAFNL